MAGSPAGGSGPARRHVPRDIGGTDQYRRSHSASRRCMSPLSRWHHFRPSLPPLLSIAGEFIDGLFGSHMPRAKIAGSRASLLCLSALAIGPCLTRVSKAILRRVSPNPSSIPSVHWKGDKGIARPARRQRQYPRSTTGWSARRSSAGEICAIWWRRRCLAVDKQSRPRWGRTRAISIRHVRSMLILP